MPSSRYARAATETENDLIARDQQGKARYKYPARVMFGPLSCTSTRNVQKFALRRRATDLSATTA